MRKERKKSIQFNWLAHVRTLLTYVFIYGEFFSQMWGTISCWIYNNRGWYEDL